MGRPRNEHRRVSRTLVVDERDDIALREWARSRYGSDERAADIIRAAIVDVLRRAGKLRRVVDDERQKSIWFGVCPLVGWDGAMPKRVEPPARLDTSRKIGGGR